MQLAYKPDWEEAQERYRAWWAGEVLDRCAISVIAPRDTVPDVPLPPLPATPFERWTDLNYAAAVNDYHMRRTFYGGEGFPVWTVGYPGHTAIPAFLGCPTELDFATGWWHPIVTGDGLDDVLHLRIDPEGAWWQFTLKALERAVRESEGRCIPSIGAFGGCGDTLAALRGTDRLLFDVLDRPDEVIAAEQYLMKMWCEVYEAFYQIVREVSDGSTCWFGLWSPGKTYAAQNDFSYMISPKMFSELFLPVIERQARYLDHTVYHVDGIGAFAHVPALCELPRLQALQILPGAGKPSPLHYLDTLKYVQRAGKNLHITVAPEEVETALRELSPKGLFLSTWCHSEEDARSLLRNVTRWSREHATV
ncbi:MAG: uroporphyrinogen decarboxylase/cobalamine-independent methonine synthase family protein [Armatimonadota bacterium]